jgi:glucose-6-phosphate 1-dehydrogenase
MKERTVEPHLFIILGATGDLTRRKLLPALFHLCTSGELAKHNTLIVGAALPELSEEAFRLWAYEGLCNSGARHAPDLRQWCEDHLHYQALREGKSADYEALATFIARLEVARNLPQNRIFYLALPPAIVPETLERLDQTGLFKSHGKSHGWVRVVFEKPFGHDFHSARALNTLLHRYLDESQIYRIDHYLGKETVQNLLAFRFANPIFESLWNRDSVESVEITVAEDLGVEYRGGYYQEAGALRDMVQNHLTQLLTVVGMEVPNSFEASEIQAEKLKVLRSISPIRAQDVVFGQYTAWEVAGQRIPGYVEESGVPPDSGTETYVALKLEIHNWRWRGVPFYLRTGKRLLRKITQVAVTFRPAPIQVFRSLEPGSLSANRLLITLQPSEGFSLCFSVKTPGRPFKFSDRALRFDYGQAFGGELPEAYETLLRDVMIGDQTLFVTANFTETAWRLYDPLLAIPRAVHPYTAGSWGPKEADALPAQEGQSWQVGW